MNNRHLVVWAFGVGLVGMASGLGACAPEVTVSRDDEPGGMGGTDILLGGSGPGGGLGGSSGKGGGGALGEKAGTGGTEPLGSAGDEGTSTPGSAGGVTDPPENCPCSRRPAAPVSRYCPRGAGAASLATVDETGGEATLEGTPSTVGVPFRVRVFAGSVASSTQLRLSELTLAPPDGFFDVSPVYRLEPDGLDFTNGGEVSIPWTVPSGLVPREIAIYFSESPNGPWERMADSYQNAGFNQATLTRSGYFVVAYPKPADLAACP